MGWLIAIAAIAVIGALYGFLLARDHGSMLGRTRRHLDAGGSIRDAPDSTPGTGGGAAGG